MPFVKPIASNTPSPAPSTELATTCGTSTTLIILEQGVPARILRPTSSLLRGRGCSWANVIQDVYSCYLKEARRARENQELTGNPGLHSLLPNTGIDTHLTSSPLPGSQCRGLCPELHINWLAAGLWLHAEAEGQCQVVGRLRICGRYWPAGISWSSRGFWGKLVFFLLRKNI